MKIRMSIPLLSAGLFSALVPLFATPGEDYTRKLVKQAVTSRPGIRSEQPRANPGPVLKAADYGFATSATAEANAGALDQISLALGAKGASALVFEKGDYRIQVRSGKLGLALRSLKDFTVVGNGARLLFKDAAAKGSGHPGFLQVSNCERILLKDFSIGVDWDDKPLTVVGRITDASANRITYEVASGVKLKPAWEIRSGFEWDAAKSCRSSVGFALSAKAPGKILDESHLEFEGTGLATAIVGQHTLLGVEVNARGVGIRLEGMNDHLTLERMGIRGTPTTAMNGYVRHLWVHHSILAPPPGGHKACDDGFMIDSDDFVFEENTVAYSHDDVMNFTAGRRGGFLGGGLLPEGAESLIADHLQFYASKEMVEKGAEFFLADKNFAPTGWKARVVSFEWQMNYYPAPDRAPHRCRMVFDRPVPALDAGKAKDYLLMRDFGNPGGYLIQNNTFSNCLRHGVWAGNGPGLIENNSFTQTGYPAIGVMMIVRWSRWYKGFYPEGVILRGNLLEGCNTALRRPADIYLATGWDNHQSWDTSTFPAVSHAIVESNTIRNSCQSALAILGASNVSILGNRIIQPGRVPLAPNALGREALIVRNAYQGRLDGNVLEEKPGASVAGVGIEGAVDWAGK